MPVIRRLEAIPGIGLLTATALIAFVGDVPRFPTARHFASFLGLTPREFSSGQSRSLGRTSKRGNSYLRMLLIHGARAVLLGAERLEASDRLRTWALRLETCRGHNKATVALANKAARVAPLSTRGSHHGPELRVLHHEAGDTCAVFILSRSRSGLRSRKKRASCSRLTEESRYAVMHAPTGTCRANSATR